MLLEQLGFKVIWQIRVYGYLTNQDLLVFGNYRGRGSRGSWNGANDSKHEYYSLVFNFKEAVFRIEK